MLRTLDTEDLKLLLTLRQKGKALLYCLLVSLLSLNEQMTKDS